MFILSKTISKKPEKRKGSISRRSLLKSSLLVLLISSIGPQLVMADGSTTQMPDEEFWRQIDLLGGNDVVSQSRYYLDLSDSLINSDEIFVRSFFETLSQKLYILDTPANYQRFTTTDGLSRPFLFARLYVIAGGENFYKTVVINSSFFPVNSQPFDFFEGLLYAAPLAHQWLTGEPFDMNANWTFESFSNASAWQK